jgi:hypothetical protein
MKVPFRVARTVEVKRLYRIVSCESSSGDAQDAEIGATKEKYAEIYNKIMS